MAAQCAPAACLRPRLRPAIPPLRQLSAQVSLPDGSPLPDAPMLDAPALAHWAHSDCYQSVGPDRMHVSKKGVEVKLVGNVENSGAQQVRRAVLPALWLTDRWPVLQCCAAC